AKFDARSLAELISDFRTVRGATLALFRSFDDDAWRRRGTASGKPVSVRAIGYMIPGHERHHEEILKTRYGLQSGIFAWSTGRDIAMRPLCFAAGLAGSLVGTAA